MPRSVSGVYTVPSGINPVVAGTVIYDTWANPTMEDIAQGITDSLDRNGRGAMLAPLKAYDGTAGAPGYAFSGSSTTGMFKGASYLGFSYSGTEAFRVNASSLRTLLNSFSLGSTTSYVGETSASNVTPALQVVGANTTDSSAGMFTWAASGAATLIFARSRGATAGTHTIVQDGDILGRAVFDGSDGTTFTEAARISCLVDGTPGLNDMPGALVFYTTPDGNNAAQERWRISNAGALVGGYDSPITTRASLTTVTPLLQRIGDTLGAASVGLFNFEDTSASSTPYAFFARSRGASVGTHTIVHNGDSLGRISFAGSDGTQFTEAARIQVEIEGAPGVNDMPGIIHFLTTADGDASPTARLSIFPDGRVAGYALHNNSGAVTGTTNQYIASGIYTPTAAAGTNMAAVTATNAQWIRVGNVVTVSGRGTVDVTVGSTFTTFTLTLPIASTFFSSDRGAGVFAVEAASTVPFMPGYIELTSGNKMAFSYNTNAGGTGVLSYNFTFTYEVN